MSLQDKLKVMSHVYEIALGKDLTDDDGDECNGYVDFSEDIILLDERISHSKRREALVHEILEIGNYHMECNLKHHVITGLSEYLMAVFQDNPWLHTYLKGE